MDANNSLASQTQSFWEQITAAKAPLSIQVEVEYQDAHSKIGQYVFAYRITIENKGATPIQIIGRHWRVIDATQNIQEVKGLGVVGEQPLIEPGKSHQYSSFSVITTVTGHMQGYFLCISESAELMIAEIPLFKLAPTYVLH